MFTGIVQAMLPIKSLSQEDGLSRFSIQFTDQLSLALEKGASIAVNGVCLSVTDLCQNVISFDAVRETLELSNLKSIQVGTMVNLERSIKYDSEVGGHAVSGHIMGTARVQSVEKDSNNCRISFLVPQDWLRYLFNKGFIAINGASLTIASVNHQSKQVAINFIPETLRSTNFELVCVGDEVNIEIDAQTQTIVDTVERVLAEKSKR
ncbi:MAG: riboflavin synthase [Gammaproteobacteria bacterium]|uniref:Riboflavin synthase n=1 Tax=OM182 bacterium TaxID=2510334 RepID=A0A520RWY4_9GAMM|nr:riboflavin synthase [Gammaproteobacteria bacterium]RZO74708.1 MAG: riboflavin synthase subunit alpha [OM182 bacterium]